MQGGGLRTFMGIKFAEEYCFDHGGWSAEPCEGPAGVPATSSCRCGGCSRVTLM